MTETGIEPVIITITLIGAENQSYKKKFLEYQLITLSKTDQVIRELIEEAKKECKFEIEDVKIRASL